jgi:molybdopterin/thiamine biosynthesis adenylyltransferase
MSEMIRDINPEADVRVYDGPVNIDNANEFLDGADLFVDGLDFYAIDIRRLMFSLAGEKGLPAVTVGPIGYGTAWLMFEPGGMTFDRYFDLTDEMDHLDKMVAFAVGLAPKAMHLSYLDLSRVNVKARTAPSTGAACQLAAGVMGVEAVKTLVGRGEVRAAPYYHQFDAFTYRFASRRLVGGNRHPVQKLKRWWLSKRFRKQLQESQSVN